MDIQMTDYENSAFVILLGMITNVINHFDVDFMMPISKIDENMDRAHARDGILYQKFWWKIQNIHTSAYETTNLKESDYTYSHETSNNNSNSSTSSTSLDSLDNEI